MFILKNRNESKLTLLKLPTNSIRPNPDQPRRAFDEYELMQLAESVKHNGILQPLSVRQSADGSYILIAGERRLRAAKIAGLSSVPCIVHSVDNRQSALFALIENLQRKDLSMFEEADGIVKLIKYYDISQHEAAEKLGMAQSTLANKLRLLRLTEQQRQRIVASRLTERHARAIVRLHDSEKRDEALNVIIAEQLNVTESDELVENMIKPKDQLNKEPPKRVRIIKDIRLFVNSLSRIVETMRKSGVEAKTTKSESEDYIEYTVKIPKSSQSKSVF